MSGIKRFCHSLQEDFLAGDESVREPLITICNDPIALEGLSPVLDVVAKYLQLGWSVAPQRPGAKAPCVKWKPLQEWHPNVEECRDWWLQWPDAGIALVLGPVSDVFVVDVDGEDAHHMLVKELGRIPRTPQVISGSGKPHRYHLLFRHPEVETKAKATPWHPNLEFRGAGGIVIAPPSRHKSGNRYRWAEGRSIDDLPLAQVPGAVLEALQQQAQRRRRRVPKGFRPKKVSIANLALTPLARTTRQFLRGEFASGPDWNGRLFRAACDLAGNGIRQEDAAPLLLAGAQPWNDCEVEAAMATIESAYADDRVPARSRPWRPSLPPGTPPEIAERFVNKFNHID